MNKRKVIRIQFSRAATFYEKKYSRAKLILKNIKIL